MADIRPQVTKEAFGMVDALHGIKTRPWLDVLRFRQAFNLLDIKQGVPLHEVNLAIDFITGFLIGFIVHDGIGVNHKGAIFAFAHIGTQFQSLPVGHPERQGTDPGIRRAIMPQGPCDLARPMLDVPRFHPGPNTLFELATILSVTWV